MPVAHALDDVHTVDPLLDGTAGRLSVYLVDAPEPTLIDTGTADSVEAICDALDTVGIDRDDVGHVLVSHIHLDHAGGAGHLADEFPNATFYIHEDGFDFLTEADDFERLNSSVDRVMGENNAYGEPKLLDPARCCAVSGGDTVDIGDRELELIYAPGHASTHYAVFDPRTEGLFTIDSAGMYFEGALRPTTPPPEFDLETTLDTVDRLRAYDPDRLFYGHFGPGSRDAVRELDRYERLLPEWVDTVRELRADHGDDVASIVDALGPEWRSFSLELDVAGVLHSLDQE
ncbi:MAG: MBL fold metallo-hydrolase [Halobacteriota archaeon]|uniref:MBL fold metallo-hydrolase n=1 Tax=Natronomonas sp. TaxID=2184060 RepID=UPI003976DD69